MSRISSCVSRWTKAWSLPMRYMVQGAYSFYGLPERAEGHRMMRGRALSKTIVVPPETE